MLIYSGDAKRQLLIPSRGGRLFPNTRMKTEFAGADRDVKEGIMQKQLSEQNGIPQRHISMMENDKRSIVKKMAKHLGKALNIGFKVFL